MHVFQQLYPTEANWCQVKKVFILLYSYVKY